MNIFVSRIVAVGLISLMVAGCGGSGSVLDEADQALVDARAAIASGDQAKAIELLEVSISLKPDTWSYYERARLLAENGDDDAAREDIDAGLELDPEHAELLWLQKQIKKPKRSRFKGSAGTPPSASK